MHRLYADGGPKGSKDPNSVGLGPKYYHVEPQNPIIWVLGPLGGTRAVQKLRPFSGSRSRDPDTSWIPSCINIHASEILIGLGFQLHMDFRLKSKHGACDATEGF